MQQDDRPHGAPSPPGPIPAPGGLHAAMERYPNLSKVLDLEMPVSVVLAEKTCSLEEVLSLREGSLIFFAKGDGEPLDFLVHDRRIGSGKAIKVRESFGILIGEVGTPRELLENVC